jgi:rhodanese-related sulfurtransferase
MNQEINQVQPKDAYHKIQKGEAVLMDIREWEEIEIFNFDIEEQLLIPMSELTARYKEIPKDKEIIVACNSGNRSQQVALYLKGIHFEKVHNLQGGIGSWLEMGLPVQWDTIKPEYVSRKDELT